jgi:hypothetical protein
MKVAGAFGGLPRELRTRPDPLRAFCYAGDITGSLDQFVIIRANKSRGGDYWSRDDYDLRSSQWHHASPASGFGR